MRRALSLLLILLLLLALGCARRPVLYPNAQYERAGEVEAQAAVDQCMERAETANLKKSQVADAAKKTGSGAVVGTATGAVSGAITGDAGTGALVGLASGAIVGFFSWMFGASEPDPIFVRYVDRCLSEQGYESVGWQ